MRYIKLYLVRAQRALEDGPYGPVRTLGDPYTDLTKAIERKNQWLEDFGEFGHSFIETHWMEVDRDAPVE